MLRKRMAPWGPLENHEMPPRRRLLEAALHVVPLLRTTWKKKKKEKEGEASFVHSNPHLKRISWGGL